MKGPLDITRELLAAGVPHEIVRLPRAITSAAELPEVLDLPAASCISVQIYDADGIMYALAVPASTPTRPATLAAALGVPRVRPADANVINVITDFCAPLVSPVCLPPTVPLVVDASLGTTDVLYAPTGDSGTVLKIRTHDLLVHTRALVAALTGPAPLPARVPAAVVTPALAPSPVPALRLVEELTPATVA